MIYKFLSSFLSFNLKAPVHNAKTDNKQISSNLKGVDMKLAATILDELMERLVKLQVNSCKIMIFF